MSDMYNIQEIQDAASVLTPKATKGIWVTMPDGTIISPQAERLVASCANASDAALISLMFNHFDQLLFLALQKSIEDSAVVKHAETEPAPPPAHEDEETLRSIDYDGPAPALAKALAEQVAELDKQQRQDAVNPRFGGSDEA